MKPYRQNNLLRQLPPDGNFFTDNCMVDSKILPLDVANAGGLFLRQFHDSRKTFRHRFIEGELANVVQKPRKVSEVGVNI